MRRDALHIGNTVQATGPFFGLENLARHGGLTKVAEVAKEGSAIKRQYIAGDPSDITLGILESALLDLASTAQQPRGFTLDNIMLLDTDKTERVSMQDLPPSIRKVVNDVLRDQQ